LTQEGRRSVGAVGHRSESLRGFAGAVSASGIDARFWNGHRELWRLLRTLFKETGDTDELIDWPSTFRQPFGLSQPHPLGLCLGPLFEFGLDFCDQGYCFWCLNFKGGVHMRTLPKTAFLRLIQFRKTAI
jgi:hypothetical protein